MKRKHKVIVNSLVFMFLPFFIYAQEIYKNPEYSVKERVRDLLSRMTIEEKVAQLRSISSSGADFRYEGEGQSNKSFEDNFRYGAGAVQLADDERSPRESALYTNEVQRWVKTNTRLGIPVLFHAECLHGHRANGGTVFPVPLALACSWDTLLLSDVFRAVGREARARGSHEAHGLNLDLGRDPRWGRIEETYGEDTYLTTRLAVSAVSALQGGANGVTSEGIVASCKHFAGYGQSIGGRNFAPTPIPRREFFDEILPPFEAAVKEANIWGIMPSHAEIDGVPCHGNSWLLTDLLRGQWGFDGVVVSDYGDIGRLDVLHHVAVDAADAALQGLIAGVDMDLPSGGSYKHLVELAESDPGIIKYIDQAVSRVLHQKFKLGLFENPYVDPDYAEIIVNGENHEAIARMAALKSIVLLKNEGNILPLDRDKLNAIAVIGPNAHPVHFGGYSPVPNIGVSILDGIREKVGSNMNVLYARGCGITAQDSLINKKLSFTERVSTPTLCSPENDSILIEEAVKIANEAEIAIVCIGGNNFTNREAVYAAGNPGDRDNINLVGQQQQLVDSILATGKPVIIVLIHGRPLAINKINDNAHSILDAYYLGQETGHAIADVLFGVYNPGGKLPVTVPRSVGQIPAHYSQKPSGKFKPYLFADSTPLFPFGYGLSYTTFKYTNLSLSNNKISKNGSLEVAFDLTNTGDITGDEIAQLYIRDEVSSVTRPVMELKGFARVNLDPGETKRVTMKITPIQLAFTGRDYEKVIEPGTFKVMVGASSADIRLKGEFQVHDEL